jgi:hypothetical protein
VRERNLKSGWERKCLRCFRVYDVIQSCGNTDSDANTPAVASVEEMSISKFLFALFCPVVVSCRGHVGRPSVSRRVIMIRHSDYFGDRTLVPIDQIKS